jgi:hypothetical protein
MFRNILSALAATVFILISGAAGLQAHEGHDHGAETPAAPATVAPRGEAHSERFEVVAVAQGKTLAIYLDDYRTNAPVEQAGIEVETPAGPAPAKALGNGVYSLDAPFLEKGGHIDLIVTVNAGGDPDILPITIDVPAPGSAAGNSGPAKNGAEMILASLAQSPLATGLAGFILGAILVGLIRRSRSAGAAVLVLVLIGAASAVAHEGHDHGPAPAAASNGDQRAQRQPDGSVFVPKPIQRIFGVRTLQTESGVFARTVELPGRIIPDPNASGYVQTAVGGVLSPPSGGFPRLGAQVKQGDILAYVIPPIAAIDVSDMRQKQGELDQQISIVQRRLARQESLVTSGAVARTQLEDTRLELEGLKDRRAALDKIRSEPVPLIAPVTGMIAEGTPITGQIAQGNAIVFHIVTPELRHRLGIGPRVGQDRQWQVAGAHVPRLRTRRSQPVDPGAFLDRRKRKGIARRPVRHGLHRGRRGTLRHRRAAQCGGACGQRPGLCVRTHKRGTLRAAAGADRAARCRACADRGRYRSRQAGRGAGRRTARSRAVRDTAHDLHEYRPSSPRARSLPSPQGGG